MSECVLLMEKDTILVIIDWPHDVHTIKTHHIIFYCSEVLILIVESAGWPLLTSHMLPKHI